MLASIKRFVKDEQGLETVEYAVMTALIVAGLILAISTLGGTVKKKFVDVETAIDPA